MNVLGGWSKVVVGLREQFESKIIQYGTSRYEKHSDEFDFWMCFSDVHRKTLRLEQLTIDALTHPEKDIIRRKLIDDYKDIANYAIMAVQILENRDEI